MSTEARVTNLEQVFTELALAVARTNAKTKSRLRPEDIEAFALSLPEVRAFWPEAEDRKIVGALSSFYLDPTLVKAAERAGLYVFGLGSGLLEVLNTPSFKPREF